MDPSHVTPEDLQDPTINAETLRQIALARPDLRSLILQHPNCHAELTAYIQQLPDQGPPPPGEPYRSVGPPQWEQQYQPYTPGYASQPPVDRSDEKVWGVIMHLGNLLLSFLVPLIIWLIYRERSQTLDQQGRAALNWAISFWIYSAVAGVLMFVLIGFVIWPILIVLDVVFCIIAAVKAGNGEAWKYPMSIPFLRVRI
ncbi:hypothetical protein GCM10023190_06560 [Enteractinococcus fodinae]|uniref:Tic20 family protein n=1 Tax=Enteractinococcus fodinae TaxID=684663 RepID=A0ABU2AZU3_9MICC|nr:DUF4870 domain-containing protein [Enteractinococcus fodinae]MDR7346865.1 putative Tic20 family protein [Enteractinococcus fodinae]